MLPHPLTSHTTTWQAKTAAVMLITLMFSSPSLAQSGIASVYGGKDGYCGSKTANGEHVNCSALTAAHLSLPFGTLVRVTNRRNRRFVTVRINDRGPFRRGRIIDLTPAGAHALGFSGLTPVDLAVVGRR